MYPYMLRGPPLQFPRVPRICLFLYNISTPIFLESDPHPPDPIDLLQDIYHMLMSSQLFVPALWIQGPPASTSSHLALSGVPTCPIPPVGFALSLGPSILAPSCARICIRTGWGSLKVGPHPSHPTGIETQHSLAVVRIYQLRSVGADKGVSPQEETPWESDCSIASSLGRQSRVGRGLNLHI